MPWPLVQTPQRGGGPPYRSRLRSSLIQIQGKGTFYCLGPNQGLSDMAFPLL